ncbi:hypothetical protein B0J11DRAFT_62816 [Dendryphion nanum]|uniref:Chromo domain-containing protein n=1 Tax=Dendryphion nanum TaxID=256645 RepID=A0A9P9IIE5_9PLEO|nr:hypothetical protein B0J11DRAFT_62816 [Dendryphion nanum]
MALRGREAGRARGRGRGRGRGGVSKSEIWEYEIYTPSPDTYESLNRYRKAAPIITEQLPDETPINNARASIVNRRSSLNDGVLRQVYLVRVQRLAASLDQLHEVDVSRILDFVSQRELERFENSEFRAEAEAQAAARRADLDERAQRWLERNARMPRQGSRVMADLGHHAEEQHYLGTKRRGRFRGSGSRGRGRGRGMGHAIQPFEQNASWEEVGRTLPADGDAIDMDMVVEEETESDDPLQFYPRPHSSIRSIAEAEQDVEHVKQTSPDLMRSAFVAHSALPMTSPIQFHRTHPHEPELDEQVEESDDESVSSAAQQLIFEREFYSPTFLAPASVTSANPTRPAAPMPISSASTPESDSNPDSDSGGIPSNILAVPHNAIPISDNEEEYAIEFILSHSFIDGIKYYLVKWEGYEEAQDWLTEDELDGARDMIREYNKTIVKNIGKEIVASGRR